VQKFPHSPDLSGTSSIEIRIIGIITAEQTQGGMTARRNQTIGFWSVAIHPYDRELLASTAI